MIFTVAVGTDGFETAGRALEAAFELAERFGATLIVLSAYPGRSPDSNMPRLASARSPDVEWASGEAKPVERIVAAAEEAAAKRGLRCSTAMAHRIRDDPVRVTSVPQRRRPVTNHAWTRTASGR